MSFAQAVRIGARYSGTQAGSETVESVAGEAERFAREVRPRLQFLLEGDNLQKLIAEELRGRKHPSNFEDDYEHDWGRYIKWAVNTFIESGFRPRGKPRLRVVTGGAK